MSDAPISETDARAMVRLLGETVAVEGGHAEKKRFLMDGLCRLIQADYWVWTLGCQIKPNAEQVYVGFMHGGFAEDRFSSLLQALEHPDMGTMAKPFYQAVAADLNQSTMLRDEIDPSGLAYKSEVKDHFKAADIGSLILSGHPLDAQSLSMVAIYRKFDDARFTEREKSILHIILEEVPWLHMLGWPEDRGATVPSLSPRQRMVLNLLLDGLGRKQIAASLEIAENTVAGYAKEVYRHFGVNSQAELMHKFLSGSR